MTAEVLDDETATAIAALNAGGMGATVIGIDEAGALPTEIGPCARCGKRTRRYGAAGRPLCSACGGRGPTAAAESTPSAVPNTDSSRDPDLWEGFADPPTTDGPMRRSVTLTRASDIRMRPVRWLWSLRMAVGTLVLLAGREGIGKSTFCADLIARITRGLLAGTYYGKPKSMIVAATEDAWEYVLVPRLTAAGADLTRVFRVDVVTGDGVDVELSLPSDLAALERLIGEADAVMVVLDPLLSRVSATIDTHRDAEVRLALEPLVRLADRAGAAVLGIIHLNKSGGTDPLTSVMGSRAFTAVARAVLFVMTDPDDEATRLLGQAKNNLGRCDVPTLKFGIDSATVAETDEGPIITGRLVWSGETDRTIRDLLEDAATAGATAETRTAVQEAADWLEDHLTSQGGSDDSAAIKKAAAAAGHNLSAVTRARQKVKVVSQSHGFPRKTFWALPDVDDSQRNNPGESATTATTATTGQRQ